MTPDQAALFRKAQESLEAARLLAGKGFASFAASRAYYAMFYATEALLLGEGPTYSKHSAVIAAFGQLFAKTGRVPKEYHRYLIEAEGIRNVGDYDIHSSLTAEEVDQHMDRARQFLEMAARLLGQVQPD
jgi:uncharacterized protein (UPF0332 family)